MLFFLSGYQNWLVINILKNIHFPQNIQIQKGMIVNFFILFNLILILFIYFYSTSSNFNVKKCNITNKTCLLLWPKPCCDACRWTWQWRRAKEDRVRQMRMEEELCNRRRENEVRRQTSIRERRGRRRLAYKRLLPNVSWQLDRDLPAVGAKLWLHLHYCHAKPFRLHSYSDLILCWVPPKA